MLLTKLIDKNTSLNKSLGSEDFITGLSDDSRKIKKGMLFAAVKGKNFDGIGFANKVINAGATAILCSKEGFKKVKNEIINKDQKIKGFNLGTNIGKVSGILFTVKIP